MMRNPISWLVTDYWAHYMAILGLIALIKMTLAVSFHLVWTFKTYLPSLYRPYRYPKIYGEWAAVTGCTSGIGLSLAKEMAQRGLNVILISRNQDKLSSLAKELEIDFKIKTKIITNDASSRESTNKMAKELAKLDIGILVNNVGVNLDESVGLPTTFQATNHSWIHKTITVNSGNAVMTMKHVLPNMIKARKGIVLNTNSSSCYTPVPMQSLYSATKVYMDILSRGISHELVSTGVAIQSICPVFVKSNMTQFSNLLYSILSISGETYAQSVVNKLGTCKRTGGYWLFDIFYGIGLLTFPIPAFMYFLHLVITVVTEYKL